MRVCESVEDAAETRGTKENKEFPESSASLRLASHLFASFLLLWQAGLRPGSGAVYFVWVGVRVSFVVFARSVSSPPLESLFLS